MTNILASSVPFSIQWNEFLVKVHPCSIYAWTVAAKPPTEIHAFSKYSFTVGMYPLENHHASSRCVLQNFARCNENIRQGTPIGQLRNVVLFCFFFLRGRNVVLLIAFVRYISVTLIYSIRNHILLRKFRL